MVDIRYPGTEPPADGMFPSYTKDLGAVPTVNVAYMDAWNWKTGGAETARLSVKGGMHESFSQNVIAELPGRDKNAGIIVVGGHHDTQADSPGADDNGTGTAAVIELTRLFASKAPFRRTIRLISFGSEEQLSVGSANYVRRHRADLAEHARFMLNFDSSGYSNDSISKCYSRRSIRANPEILGRPLRRMDSGRFGLTDLGDMCSISGFLLLRWLLYL